VDVTLGGQARTLRFRSAEVMLLEERLGMDVLAFLARQGGSTRFVVEAVFAGLSSGADKKLTPKRVTAWLDEFDGDVDDLQKAILYAIARGKPAQQAKKMVEALDEAFPSEDGGRVGPLVTAPSP
jgi:hypothetical protein